MDAESPLIDLELARQLYTVATPEEANEVRAMFAEFVADIRPRISKLGAMVGDPTAELTAARELHQLRGVTANFGLARAAAAMRELEFAWAQQPATQREAGLAEIGRCVDDSLRELQTLYPFLA